MVEFKETALKLEFDGKLPNDGFVPSAKSADAALANAGNALVNDASLSDVSAKGVKSAKSGGGGLAQLLSVQEVSARPVNAAK